MELEVGQGSGEEAGVEGLSRLLLAPQGPPCGLRSPGQQLRVTSLCLSVVFDLGGSDIHQQV